MRHHRSWLTVPAFAAVFVLAFSPVGIGSGFARSKDPGDTGDPGEQAAIRLVEKHGGSVLGDNAQPNRPVIAVSVFRDTFTDADLEPLAALTRLRKLSLSNTRITGVGFKALGGLKDLTELDIPQNPIDDAGLKEVAALKQLKVLTIRGTKVTDAGVRALAPLKQLDSLSVANSSLGNTAAVHIANNLEQLEELYFDNSNVGDVGVLELARLPHLRVLTLNGTRVTDTGLAALPQLRTLEELQLSFDITDQSATILARCKNLRVLRLFHTEITDRGLRELAGLPQLKELDLAGSAGVSNQAIAEFIRSHPNCGVNR